MWGRATLTTVASRLAIALAATVAASAVRPRAERSTRAFDSPSVDGSVVIAAACHRRAVPWYKQSHEASRRSDRSRRRSWTDAGRDDRQRAGDRDHVRPRGRPTPARRPGADIARG